MVTGKDELSVKELVKKLGSMANSTKCCAGGTISKEVRTEFKAPLIPTDFDEKDPTEIRQDFGKIR